MTGCTNKRQFHQNHVELSSVPLLFPSPYLITQYHIFPKEFELNNILQDIFELTNTGSREEPYFLLPNGCMTLIFQLYPKTSRCVFCGPLTTMRRLLVASGTTIFCARIRPGSGDWLTGGHASFLTDRAVPLDQYLSGTNQLSAELYQRRSFHERRSLLCQYLSAQGAKTYQPMALLERCIGLIQENRGIIKVAELASTVGCSERYLNRIFQSRVGISTKLYSEIIQLHFSLYNILHMQTKSLLNTAVTCGYFDQTHMNRSYRKFLDCTARDIRYVDYRNIHADDILSAL